MNAMQCVRGPRPGSDIISCAAAIVVVYHYRSVPFRFLYGNTHRNTNYSCTIAPTLRQHFKTAFVESPNSLKHLTDTLRCGCRVHCVARQKHRHPNEWRLYENRGGQLVQTQFSTFSSKKNFHFSFSIRNCLNFDRRPPTIH